MPLNNQESTKPLFADSTGQPAETSTSASADIVALTEPQTVQLPVFLDRHGRPLRLDTNLTHLSDDSLEGLGLEHLKAG